jgi:hypothetical protein
MAMLLVLANCKTKPHHEVLLTSDTTRFYPVNEYLMQQIEHVDSGAFFIYKITIENGKRDSIVIDKQQFKLLSKGFLEYNINDKSLHKYYKENFFLDESTHSYTFNYRALDTSLPLRTVDVLLDTETQQVKWVFLNKVKTEGANTVNEKASWKNNDRFLINTIKESGDSSLTQQNIVVWGNQP